MSFDALSWAARQTCAGPTPKLVLMMLANYANEEFSSYPSIAKLSELCSCNERTVMRALQSLIDEGLVKSAPRYLGKGKQTSNQYTLNVRGDNIDTPREVRGDIFDREGVTNSTGDTVRDIQSNKKTNKKKRYTEEFEAWWQVYPRKDGSKAKAFDLWKKHTDQFIDIQELYSVTVRFKNVNHGKDQKFIPHATTWLNQSRYETVGQVQAITTNRNHLAG